MIKVIGVEMKAGTFTDKASNKDIVYDNVVLHAIGSSNPSVQGEEALNIKVKRIDLQTWLHGASAITLIGKYIAIEASFYGGKTVISNIRVVEESII